MSEARRTSPLTTHHPPPTTPHWSIYVHVPFCSKRCPYCAFVLVESDGSLHEAFVDRVCREIDESPHHPTSVSSLYFGGGTPSMLSAHQIRRIADRVARPSGGITLEANPEDVAEDRLRKYADAGVTRVSLGIQAVTDEDLGSLGREHSARQAEESYRVARKIIGNVNVDLIFGMPGQDARRAFERVVQWDPPHVSLYGLTFEPGTEFTRRGMVPMPQEEEADQYRAAIQIMSSAGYRHYELSNFAKPGFESRHNLGYWEGGPYLGFGPGAHSYVPHRRWANLSNVRKYIDGADPVMSTEELTEEQRILERVFLGLRRDVGVDLLAFQEEFGVGMLTRFRHEIAELESLGKIENVDGFVRLTIEGKLVADEVIGKFA